jgi:ABC-type antimicrobial peptide transport system permease subunit
LTNCSIRSGGAQVLWLVVREALQLVAAGSLAGLVVYGVSSFDPRTLVASAAAMLVIAAIAVTIPAIRATRVDPRRALR